MSSNNDRTTEQTRLLQDCNSIANSPAPFSFDGLLLRPNTLRLLRVLPGTHAGQLQCVLEVLPTDTEYTTLSYQWGIDEADKEILLNGSPFVVRRNLWDFLRVARRNYSCWLWIDAVCINQSDEHEKARVVRGMAQIYSCGALNFSWLGDSGCSIPSNRVMSQDVETVVDLVDADSSMQQFIAALEAIAWVDGAARFNRTIKQGEFLKAFWLLEYVCTHPYWRRMWIVQEVLLSERKIILFANIRVSWAVFVKLLMHITTDRNVRLWSLNYISHGWNCRQRLEAIVHAWARKCMSAVGAEDVGYLKELSTTTSIGAYLLSMIRPMKLIALEILHVDDLIQATPAILLLLEDKNPMYTLEGMLEGREENILMFMSNFRDSECSDRRDRIFALLGLASVPDETLVSYMTNVYDLFYKACRVFAGGSLDARDQRDLLLRLSQIQQEAGRPTDRRRSRYKTTVVTLMEHMRLSPLDLVFGDDKHRAQVKLVTKCSDPLQSLPTTTMLQTVSTGTYDILSGICDVCGDLVHYQVEASFSTRYVLLQCHAQLPALSHDDNIPSAADESHVLLYSYYAGENEAWGSLYQPRLSSIAPHHEFYLRQLMTHWPPRPSMTTRSNIRQFMPTILNLHQAWHQGDLPEHSRMFSFLKFGNLKLNYQVRQRRRLGNLSSLRAVFKKDPGSAKTVIDPLMIKALQLEEQAEKNMILSLEQEGYEVEYQGVLTEVLGYCVAC